MRRQSLSRPVRLALSDDVLRSGDTVLDYGCGLGGDVSRLRELGFVAAGWDPVHAPDGERTAAQVVNLGYVVNVIEDPAERAETLRRAWALAEEVLVVSARLTDERPQLRSAADLADGVLTGLNTFQKFFLQSELREWIRQQLDRTPIAAAPGVFYVFRGQERLTEYSTSRFRTRITPLLRTSRSDRLAAHPQFARTILDAMSAHGREVVVEDFAEGRAMSDALGGMTYAVRHLLEQFGPERWAAIRRTRRDDLLVFLALSRFEGRPAFRTLPDTVQRDVRSHFGSYAEALRSADEVLLATGQTDAIEDAIEQAPCGKLLPTAFYVHSSALQAMPVTLRLYEGCARSLSGAVDGANLLKLGRRERKISYLVYPDFERVGHPELRRSIRVDLQTFDVRTRRYEESGSPPLLHRKETFVLPDDPHRARFERLTNAEERAGLLAMKNIGTRDGWLEALASTGYVIRGHALRKSSG